ncbi:MAG: p-cumate 2,3-dioxygenase subunit beta [Solirubrobacteraceae bacterium]|jgi:p-cumate 2,3-dioxygenase beta subunit|nr:p-cumate 2,3-dioxygenase subunit beta [Solirubrobacteraceae bacterium]
MQGSVIAPSNDATVLLRRLEVEDFLFHEAELLDRWRLEQWLALFTADCRYVVPATDLPDGDPRVTLGLVDDDLTRLRGRVERLNSAKAYREFPWSRTRRLVTNVRVSGAADELRVTAAFAIYRYRKGDEQVLVGSYDYRLIATIEGLRIREKRSTLAAEALRPHGTVSIIL